MLQPYDPCTVRVDRFFRLGGGGWWVKIFSSYGGPNPMGQKSFRVEQEIMQKVAKK